MGLFVDLGNEREGEGCAAFTTWTKKEGEEKKDEETHGSVALTREPHANFPAYDN